MKVSITRVQQRLLLFLSATGYTAWFAGLGDPLHAEEIGVARTAMFALHPRTNLPRIASFVVRDPFAGAVTSREHAALPPRAGQSSSAPSAEVADDTVVPDIAGSAAIPSEATALVVRATIAGPTPVAYVARGSVMDIVRVGDTLADHRITAIDLHGIGFDDGSRLDLSDAFAPSPPPRSPQEHPLALGIDDLRRLLVPTVRATTAAPAPPLTPAPAPSEQSAYPTAGPLPTIDARGLPVGVNPTPDPHDPTPYPDPYPYAPPARR